MTEELRPTPGGEGYENPEATAKPLEEGPIGQAETEAPDPQDTAIPVIPAGYETGADGEAPAEAPADGQDLEAKTNAELQQMLADRGLPTSGTKSELIDRLNEG